MAALAGLVFLPVLPLLPVLLPVSQAVLLLVPAIAVCALIGWWHGGRLSLPLIWIALALWMLRQPVAGSEFGWGLLMQGWSVLLAGTFGILCVLRPRRAFFDQALPAVAVALGLAVLLLLVGTSAPGAQFGQLVLAEYANRVTNWTMMLQRFGTSPEWLDWTSRAPQLGAVLQQVQEDYAAMPRRSLRVLPAVLALQSLATLALAWGVYQRLGRERLGPAMGRLRDFRFNDQLIWGLVVGVTLLVLPAFAEVRDAGMNLLVFFGALYVVRGLGVLSALLATRRWTLVLLGVAAVLAWHVVALFALLFGVSDTWLDWRRRARPTS